MSHPLICLYHLHHYTNLITLTTICLFLPFRSNLNTGSNYDPIECQASFFRFIHMNSSWHTDNRKNGLNKAYLEWGTSIAWY
ncbi:hypothetical protein HN51_037121 [Arachis hypogaea]